jgi:hypothetical protein
LVKYNGSDWETVGSRGFGYTSSYSILRFSGDGTPFVAAIKAYGGEVIMYYDTDQWNLTGDIIPGDEWNNIHSFSIDQLTNIPYIAFDIGSKGSVMYFEQ